VISQRSDVALRRAGFFPTWQVPTAVLTPQLLRAHTIPLGPPLPDPALRLQQEGAPPPDRGVSAPWPY